MKKLYWLLLITLTSCQQRQQPFTEIDEKYNDIEYLLTQIRPNKEVNKWELFYNNLGTIKSIYNSKQDIALNDSARLKIERNGFNGFFEGCLPAYCSYLIATAIGDTIKIIDSEVKLENFIGRVDNIEEAIIISKIKGFDLLIENKKGQYRITKNGYEFIGQKYTMCPEMILKYNIQVTESRALETHLIDKTLISKNCIEVVP